MSIRAVPEKDKIKNRFKFTPDCKCEICRMNKERSYGVDAVYAASPEITAEMLTEATRQWDKRNCAQFATETSGEFVKKKMEELLK